MSADYLGSIETSSLTKLFMHGLVCAVGVIDGMVQMGIQLTLGISKSEGPSETLQDIRTST